MPFFSIIIPTYNRAHTIRRPLDSILAQTFTDWELIIVDDGSTDDTQSVVDSYHDVRISYVWQENQERSAARNHGIRLAKGEWICFLDSDDEYMNHHLETHYNCIIENPTIKAFRTGLFYFKDGNCIKKTLNSPGGFLDHYPFEHVPYFSFHSKIFNDVMFDERFFILEDMHFLLRLSKKYEIKQIDDWSYIYHSNHFNSGGVGINYVKNLMNRKACLNDMLNFSTGSVKHYVKWTICTAEIFMMFGHLKYNKIKFPKSIVDNIKILFRFPLVYLKVVLRMLYVKIGEWSGLYRTKYRF
ncbi:MAG: glycosyltransferase family 2 protein [Saprospiraceae bacterium]|nr:glycosyltransferase family 2 protein [Saprospiraceae bacterium]